ncbi:MAG: rhomboid family intramembrane serine protease [Luteolibacter sp.]
MEHDETSTLIPWDDLILVGQYPSLEHAQDHGLVILAMGEACWVSAAEDSGKFNLHAETSAAGRVGSELLIYTRELDDQLRLRNLPEPIDRFHYPAGWKIFLIWMSCLLAVFFLQWQDYTLTDRAASSSIGLIDRSEWWRPFTALFLHADVQHLVGNLVSGAIFGTLVSRSLGPLRGWALILACGTFGNCLTSLVTYPVPFISIGASTAVFGALGILSGLGFSTSLRSRSSMSWAKVAAPVIAGIVMLGWLGGGGPDSNTDVLGHVFGFSSGLVSGILVGEFRQKLSKTPVLAMV